ncbi:MAG: T9SS type A sorting domain-containing protein [Flavobacteriales bacterium]|nr:T9SS type A sorting domain-containing protein [Flavobacteriales bacterium]
MKSSVGTFCLFSIVIVLISCSEKEPRFRTGPDSVEMLPSDHMYAQRAYPNGIDQKAIDAAWEQRRAILKSGEGKSQGVWQQEGPLNIGGRITDIAISPVDDNTFFIGCAVGGVFRTTDRGESWTPVFDTAGRPSIGDVTIAPSDPDRVYVGTGEANGSGTSGAFFGDGVWRSDDGGDTWQEAGLPDSQHIGRLVVHPTDPDKVFAATTGLLYGTSPTRGLYRTADGGANWEQVLFVTDSTACIDVVMDPVNTDIIYASTWERRRRPWGRVYGGVTSRVYRSADGGDTWQQLTNGLPEDDTQTGRIGLAISATDPNVVYASYTTNAITNVYAGLYRSNDGGENWTLAEYDDISDVNSSFGWYFGNIRVNPHDINDIYVLGQKLYRTQNNAVTWTQDNQMHVDFHAMEWSAQDPNMVLCGTDGGLYISENNGVTWEHFENLPITQFYQIEVDESWPGELYGGTQDNNTLRTLSGELDDYEAILGGDGFHVNVDPEDNSYVYAEYQWGNLFRSDNNAISMDYAIDDIDQADRTNWNTPVILSTYDPSVVYYGSNRLWRSDDRALSWSVISPDLTQGQHPSGSGSYGTLTTLAASSQNQDVIYTGSDDGMVHVTFNGGGDWEMISADLPDRYVTGLAIHPDDDQVAYVTFSGFRNTDYTPHVFKTINGGQSWMDISGNLPNIPVNDILLQAEPSRLYVATDMGVWFSEDDGLSWSILGENLPPTIMSHLQLHEMTNTLYIGTFGRSIYSFDLAQIDAIGLEESESTQEVLLYPNPTAEQITIRSDQHLQESYVIRDIQGKAVKSGILNGPNNEIGIHDLADGSYTMHIGEGLEMQIKRFTVIKN